MLKATPLEFRLRFLIHVVLFLIGFTAPWNYLLHLDSIRTWQFLAAWPARSGAITFSAATISVLVLGILFALAAAIVRTWAAAYLSPAIVQAPAMHGDRIVADGPYRHLRNPLYLGIVLHTFALALLMQPTGAVFTILTVTFFNLRLIAGEESFLTTQLGAPYLTYCKQVPRLLPSITPRVPSSGLTPHWPTAILGEIYMWGVVASFAIAGWRYNAQLIIQGVLISLGLSLIARAFLTKAK